MLLLRLVHHHRLCLPLLLPSLVMPLGMYSGNACTPRPYSGLVSSSLQAESTIESTPKKEGFLIAPWIEYLTNSLPGACYRRVSTPSLHLSVTTLCSICLSCHSLLNPTVESFWVDAWSDMQDLIRPHPILSGFFIQSSLATILILCSTCESSSTVVFADPSATSFTPHSPAYSVQFSVVPSLFRWYSLALLNMWTWCTWLTVGISSDRMWAARDALESCKCSKSIRGQKVLSMVLYSTDGWYQGCVINLNGYVNQQCPR